MAENLIMNHSLPVPPDDALNNMIPSSEDQLISQELYGREVARNVLSCLDPSKHSMQRHGTTELEIMVDGRPVKHEIRIKTIPAHLENEINKAVQEKVAMLPTTWNVDANDLVQDRGNPLWRKLFHEMQDESQKATYRKFLEGTELMLKSVDGKSIVWDCDNTEFRDLDGAIKSLDAMGITQLQINSVVAAINRLSEIVDEKQREEDVKK